MTVYIRWRKQRVSSLTPNNMGLYVKQGRCKRVDHIYRYHCGSSTQYCWRDWNSSHKRNIFSPALNVRGHMILVSNHLSCPSIHLTSLAECIISNGHLFFFWQNKLTNSILLLEIASFFFLQRLIYLTYIAVIS